jgi:hypothetical protein
MKKVLGLLIILAAVLLWNSPTLAQPGRAFKLPSSAVKISDNLYDLGKVNGAQGYAILRRDNYARPGGGAAKAPKCYAFMSKGARWKATESYLTDIADPATATSLETWDSQVGFDIFGPQATGEVDGADTVAPDNKNELYYGEISDPGVIGVTIVWGYFSGPTFARELIEWDMILDKMDFSWGDATVDPSVMDYQNILTHELGHSSGMADIYDASCSEVTMYGYGTEGETKKRDLTPQDITGIKELYR